MGTKPRKFIDWVKESKLTLFKKKFQPEMNSPVLKLQDIVIDKQMLLDVVLKMRKPLTGIELNDITHNYTQFKKCFYGLKFNSNFLIYR